MKKVMICAMVGALVMSMGITSFAENEVTFTTSTAYGTNEDIVVTTVVNNAKPGESYTYLAHDKEKKNLEDDGAIVYVNQIDVPEGNTGKVQFSYEADKATLTTTELLYAGTNVQVNSEPKALDYYIVNVTHNGSAGKTYYIPAGNIDGAVTYDMSLSGVNVTAVKFNNTDVVPAKYTLTDTGITVELDSSLCNNDLSEPNTLEVTTVAKSVIAPEARKAVAFIAAGDGTEQAEAKAKLSVLGQVDTSDEDVEYGIIVTTNETVGRSAEAFKVGSEGVVAYKALGHGTTGLFAVQLIGDATETCALTTTTHYVRTYTAIGANYSYSNDIITVNPAN